MTETIELNTSVQQEIERNYRHNFLVNALDGASWWFGMSFMSSAIILPLYISHFTDNPIVIGLIPFLTSGGYLLPQLFTSNFVERAPVKKWFPVTIGFFLERVPIFLMAPAAYFLATSQPDLALLVFLLLFAWHTFGGGMIIVGWQDMVAKIIPVDRRGRFFGITNFVGNGSGILGAVAVSYVLEKTVFPSGFVLSFTAASILVFLSWIFIAQTREPAVVSNKPRVSQINYLRSLPDIVRKDHNFLRYLSSSSIFALSGMATGFLAVYSTRTWNLPDSQAGGFVIVMQCGMAIANLFFGFLADRQGHKLSLEICSLLNILCLGLTIVATDPIWFFPIFFLRGAINAGAYISGISIVFEFTGENNRPTYIGLANTIMGAAGAIAPLIGGWLAGAAGYNWMFLLATILGVTSWVLLHFTVKEPRTAKGKTA